MRGKSVCREMSIINELITDQDPGTWLASLFVNRNVFVYWSDAGSGLEEIGRAHV